MKINLVRAEVTELVRHRRRRVGVAHRSARAERELARQAEVAYARTVRDWHVVARGHATCLSSAVLRQRWEWAITERLLVSQGAGTQSFSERPCRRPYSGGTCAFTS